MVKEQIEVKIRLIACAIVKTWPATFTDHQIRRILNPLMSTSTVIKYDTETDQRNTGTRWLRRR